MFLGGQAGVASVEGDLAAIDVNVDSGGAQSQAGQDVEEFLVGGGGCRWQRGRMRQGC